MVTLEAIYVCENAGGEVRAVDLASVGPTGLIGDRYARGAGTFSRAVEAGDAGRAVTLIAAETIDELAMFADGSHRRNLVVRGLRGGAASLLRASLRIGDVVLRIERTCPPCRHLSRLTGLDTMALLRGRGGWRASVVVPGAIRARDSVKVLPPPRAGST